MIHRHVGHDNDVEPGARREMGTPLRSGVEALEPYEAELSEAGRARQRST
jgi:hypothetical protein